MATDKEALAEFDKLMAEYPTFFQLGKWVTRHKDLLRSRLTAAEQVRINEGSRTDKIDEIAEEAAGRITTGDGDFNSVKAEVAGAILKAQTAAEQVRASEWQPIETAPKDGTTIFGANTKLAQRGLVHFNANGEWEMVNGLTNYPVGIGFYPTHWMQEPKLLVGND